MYILYKNVIYANYVYMYTDKQIRVSMPHTDI